MLHMPDFLGYEDAVQMAGDHPDAVRRALRLKKIGNEIVRIIGGREIHPINLCVGGLYKAPAKRELRACLPDLQWGLDAAIETVRLSATLPFEDFEQDYEFVCLSHPAEYPITEGRLTSNKGLDVAVQQYDDVLVEEHVEHSTALHTRVVGRDGCHVGPLARYALNYDRLTPIAKQMAKEVGLGPMIRNPFKSIIVRSVETILAFEEAIRLVEEYERPDVPRVDVTPQAGTGYGCTEAPRGICYHRYTIDKEGVIQDAKIVSPTAVNQRTIERDLWDFVEPNMNMPDDRLQWVCEQAIRNYDPCISCSAHFLDLKVDRV